MEEEKQRSSKPGLPPIFQKDNLNIAHQPRVEKVLDSSAKIKKSGSMSLIELKKIRKTCKLKSNITSIVKRYATYLFTSANLDKDKDFFSKKKFCELLKAHPSIFDVYLAGFHTYIWQVNALGQPEYVSIKADIQGSGNLWEGGKSTPFFFKLIKSTILAFENS